MVKVHRYNWQSSPQSEIENHCFVEEFFGHTPRSSAKGFADCQEKAGNEELRSPNCQVQPATI
jgi:hypothetical protein